MYTCTVHNNLLCTRLQNYTIGASLMSVSVSVPWNSSYSQLGNTTDDTGIYSAATYTTQHQIIRYFRLSSSLLAYSVHSTNHVDRCNTEPQHFRCSYKTRLFSHLRRIFKISAGQKVTVTTDCKQRLTVFPVQHLNAMYRLDTDFVILRLSHAARRDSTSQDVVCRCVCVCVCLCGNFFPNNHPTPLPRRL